MTTYANLYTYIMTSNSFITASYDVKKTHTMTYKCSRMCPHIHKIHLQLFPIEHCSIHVADGCTGRGFCFKLNKPVTLRTFLSMWNLCMQKLNTPEDCTLLYVMWNVMFPYNSQHLKDNPLSSY